MLGPKAAHIITINAILFPLLYFLYRECGAYEDRILKDRFPKIRNALNSCSAVDVLDSKYKWLLVLWFTHLPTTTSINN